MLLLPSVLQLPLLSLSLLFPLLLAPSSVFLLLVLLPLPFVLVPLLQQIDEQIFQQQFQLPELLLLILVHPSKNQ